MSITAVRSYFRTRLNGLGESLREWPDGFNFENIPQTILNKSYHLETGLISGNAKNQNTTDISYPLTVRVFLKGYNKPADAIDNAIELGEDIVCDAVNPVNSNNLDVKTVEFVSMGVEPLDESNDNAVILSIDFSARIFLKTV